MTLRTVTDRDLIEAYVQNRSEAAFADLVKRHLDWVHSVAVRRVGDSHLAEDVVQSVFVLLASKARDFRPEVILGGWLFRTTCHVAAHALRAEQRRKNRETTAHAMIETNSQSNDDLIWQQLAPHLDLAVSALSDVDRSAILMRFYEKAPMCKVGERLGVSEEAAKKRVHRAMERMRDFLGKKGVKMGTVTLAAVLMGRTVYPAPAAMADAATKVAMAATAASASATLPPLAQETLRTWQWAKVKLGAGLAVGSLELIFAIVSAGSSLNRHSAPQFITVTSRDQVAPVRHEPRLATARRSSVVADTTLDTETNNLTLTGRVIDKLTHDPVPGATVHVRQEISSSTENRVLEESTNLTDANGQFVFTLTQEESTNRAGYLDFEVTHPGYARRPWDGYSLTMLRTNEKVGQRPFYEALDMARAEAIRGAVLHPDGSPAADVKILIYSKSSKTDMAEYGSFDDTRTDASGRFRINAAKGGEAVLWLLPQDYSPETHLLHQQRGDLGQFTLEEGVRLVGKVLDSEGAPVSHVWVNAELSGGPSKKPIGMPVMDALSRSVLSDEKGEFETGPLPVGDYDLLVSETPRDSLAEDHTSYVVPDVFLHQPLKIEGGQSTQTVEIRAVPQVTVGIQQMNAKGNGIRTHEVNISGRIGNSVWWFDARPDQGGTIIAKVPQGLTHVRIRPLVNEHQSTRYRWSANSPWRNEDELTVPTLDHDTNGISIIYYTAPNVLIRAVTEDGSSIPDFKCDANYLDDKKPYTEAPQWINGAKGDVNFDKQEDGRWRSQSLLPDEDIVVNVKADGFKTWTGTINVAEGATHEIEATLKRE